MGGGLYKKMKQKATTNGEELKKLSKKAPQQELRMHYGVYSVSYLAQKFGVCRSTLHRDLEELGKEALDENLKEFLLLQDDILSDLIKQKMLELFEHSNPAYVIGAAKVLLKLLDHAVKIRQDLGVIPLPIQHIQQEHPNAITHDDFAKIYEEMMNEETQ